MRQAGPAHPGGGRLHPPRRRTPTACSSSPPPTRTPGSRSTSRDRLDALRPDAAGRRRTPAGRCSCPGPRTRPAGAEHDRRADRQPGPVRRRLRSAAAAADQAASARQSDSLVPAMVWQIGLLVLLAILLVAGADLRAAAWCGSRQRRRRLDRARATGNPGAALAGTGRDRHRPGRAVAEHASPSARCRTGCPGTAWTSAAGRRCRGGRHGRAGPVQRAAGARSCRRTSIAALDQALTRWARRTDRRLSLLHRWLPRSLFSRQPRWHR